MNLNENIEALQFSVQEALEYIQSDIIESTNQRSGFVTKS